MDGQAKWTEFIRLKAAYKDTFQKMQKEFDEETAKYLKKAYIVIVCFSDGVFTQIPFNVNDAYTIALDYSPILVPTAESVAYISLVKEHDKVKEDKDKKPAEKVREKIEKFKVEKLDVQKFRVEVRFPYVDMEYIQRVKTSEFCDRELTEMSRASINVVLKREGKKDGWDG
jgi:hypothetical protein